MRALRKNVWSQGAVPFLLVVTPNKIEVCNGFQPPSMDSMSIDWNAEDATLPDVLENFTAERISSSITWSDFELHRDSSVDNKLVDAIEALNDHARVQFPEFSEDRDLINALIGKFIYIYVLVDRNILSVEWLSSRLAARTRKGGLPFLQAISSQGGTNQNDWTAEAALAVFDVVDDAINGSVFALAHEQRAKIPEPAAGSIRRALLVIGLTASIRSST